MLGHIIRKEILTNLSSPTFLGTFVFCFILILLSLYTGLRSYSDQREPLSDTLGRLTVDLVLMGLLTVVFFAGAYVSFLKYDVR
ncbi:MAG: hypothetical protein A3F84_19345 [Candidatus Handelsmanbacteria bacterium RIFCSPLOWO2_12_FULL_64_10]|uniref:Uncharacterized protein n=1 Tax=Handelsmanbacteria sp. (strain RIFCSPLOWO2_12_FULL_64_10) TaxID=1817868 RepID=A0A1F6CSN6_HANXR|nr:MAG: hypothetical protein A3F84_19345 [Candidatus Handelsmanbacteria bacterium RIFCSPLOWO2_12_FULL_64_10]